MEGISAIIIQGKATASRKLLALPRATLAFCFIIAVSLAVNTAYAVEKDAPPAEPQKPQTDAPKPQPQAEKKEEKKSRNFVYRYFDSIFGTPEDPNKPRLIVYPVVGFSPETSWEFGLSGLYVYYANNDPKNRLSEISAFGFVTLESQYGLHLEHAIYTDQDRWFFLGEGRVQNFPLLYYGIGSNSPPEYQASVDETSVLIRERLLRKIAPSFYIGPEFSFDLLSSVKFNFRDGVEPELPLGSEGSLNVGIGLGLVYDSRHNVLNTRDGLFSELAVLHSNPTWGSKYNFTTVQSDTRYYFPVNSRDTLAAQLFGQFTFGDVPFNELSTLGGDSLMRGYYLGRFRDRHFIGTQLEYRFLPFPFTNSFARRFGATVFAATGSVFSGPQLPPLKDFVLAGGAGLRFLLFPDKDIYTRGDLAFTREGPAFYIFIGEAF